MFRGNANSKGSNASRERELGQRRQKALVIEDVRSAKIHLNARHYDCDRMTHSEALSSNHAITEKLRNREYSVPWISTPADWHYKRKKSRSKMLNITKWMKLSDSTGLLVMIFGLLGFFWNIEESHPGMQDERTQD